MVQQQQPSRFERLLTYVEADPKNLQLLSDAADAAAEEGRFEEAVGLVERHAALAPAPARLINILGLAAMQDNRFEDAAGIFQSLSDATDDVGARYNLAWAKDRLGAHEAVAALLDDRVLERFSAARAMKVRALHHLDRLDEALALGEDFTSDDADLSGALATAALDADRLDRARDWALKGASTSEGQSTLGMLALAEEREDEAAAHFEQALKVRPDSARSLLGLGLIQLERDEPAKGAALLDQSAQAFGDHLGAWVAAGWAHLVAGDRVQSRARFEKALEIDDTFAEAQGAIALVDLLDGQTEAASRRAETALRLDRNALGGLLVKSLLLEAQGDTAMAERVRAIGMNAPIGPNGRTVAQSLAALALKRR